MRVVRTSTYEAVQTPLLLLISQASLLRGGSQNIKTVARERGTRKKEEGEKQQSGGLLQYEDEEEEEKEEEEEEEEEEGSISSSHTPGEEGGGLFASLRCMHGSNLGWGRERELSVARKRVRCSAVASSFFWPIGFCTALLGDEWGGGEGEGRKKERRKEDEEKQQLDERCTDSNHLSRPCCLLLPPSPSHLVEDVNERKKRCLRKYAVAAAAPAIATFFFESRQRRERKKMPPNGLPCYVCPTMLSRQEGKKRRRIKPRRALVQIITPINGRTGGENEFSPFFSHSALN